MDLYSKGPYTSVEEMYQSTEVLRKQLFSTVYEYRDEDGTKALLSLLSLKRDQCLLELQRQEVGDSLAVAKIQGKISVIGDFLRDVLKDMADRKGASADDDDLEIDPDEDPRDRKRDRRRRRRVNIAREAGILS